MFPIRVLPIRSSSVRFQGEGGGGSGSSREPYQKAIVRIESDPEAEASLQLASQALSQSHLVAFPTETVYGLGANALDEKAALKIFKAKGRPVDNPLIVHISDMDMLDKLVPDGYQMNQAYRTLVSKFWPGAMTLLFPVDEAKVPSVTRCGLKTLGVRMPSHPVARALIAASGLPLAAPSANASGRPSPTTAMHVFHDMTSRIDGQIQGRLPYIIDGGPCHVGVESTVIDGVTDSGELRILRPGGIGVEAVEEALREKNLLRDPDGSSVCDSSAVALRVYGKDLKRSEADLAAPTTPGMKYRHYSPDAEVVLLVDASGRDGGEGFAQPLKPALSPQDTVSLFSSQRSDTSANKLCIGLMSLDDSGLTSALLSTSKGHHHPYTLRHFSLGSRVNPEQAAQRLFEGLRALDEGENEDGSDRCDVIFVEAPNDDAGVGLAVMNRLQKAASSVLYITL